MNRRHWPQQIHLLIASGIFLTILVLVYQIAGRHNRRFDLTRDQFHSVSAETVEILNQMKRSEIGVKAFFADEDGAQRQYEMLLKQMATHHPRFRYQFFDPDRLPSVAKRFRVDSYRTSILEYEGRQERIQDFSEEGLTNALIRLAHPQTRTLCFTVGHGEIPLAETDRAGFSEFKEILQNHQYQLKEIQLAGREIPQECTAVVMAGPRYELLPEQIELLRKFPETGKGFLLLIDPMDPGEGKSFVQLAEGFGLELGGNVIVDKMSQLLGGDYLVPFVAQYADHPVTKRFQAATLLPMARTVRKASQGVEGFNVTELAFTTEGSWAETDLKKLENGEAELNPEADFQGPFSVAAAVELSKAPPGARVVVVGDSDFLTNTHLRLSGNKDFALNSLQWLAQDDNWIAIRPRGARFEPLLLQMNQSVGIAAFTVGGLPLSVLLIGSVGIWRRRRKSA